MESLDEQLAVLLQRCSRDEKRVMLVQLQRLDRWRKKYGPLELAGDPRDFMREMAEESVDGAFYAAALYIRAQDELAAMSPVPPLCQHGPEMACSMCASAVIFPTASRPSSSPGAAEAGPAGGEAGTSQLPTPRSSFDVTDGKVVEK